MKHPIQITIPQPCHEDWNKMTPQEQGRFCDSCQKCVVDFTNFSDAELYQYLLDNAGKKACGRFRTEQLNRPIQIPYQPHSQLYKWIIAAGLALVFLSTPETNSFARAPFIATYSFYHAEEENDKKTEDTTSIKGIVLDMAGDPIVNAVIRTMVKGTQVSITLTDINGRFSIASVTNTPYDIIANYLGHRETTVKISEGVTPQNLQIYMQKSDKIEFYEMGVIEYHVPLMDEFDGGHTKTIRSEEIEQSAY